MSNSLAKQESTIRTRSPDVVGGGGPVTLRVIKSNPQDNTNTIELRVSYDKAEVPGRAYYADYCNVLRGRASIALIFGKLKPETSQLRNKIEIAFPEEMFIRQLWKNAIGMLEKAKEQSAKRPLNEISDLVDTDTVQVYRANNVLMIAAADDALMDFYYIAPTEIHYAFTKKRSEIALDPVIRIVLSGSLLFEMLEKCGSLAAGLPDFARIMDDESS